VKLGLLRVAAVSLTLLVAAGCGGNGKTNTADVTPGGGAAAVAQATAQTPVRGGTLTAVMTADPATFDPVRVQDVFGGMVLELVADSLFEVDKDGNVVGRLVETSENPAPNVYVWTLRKGITFQDGTPLDAEAVKFNLERHMSDEKAVTRGTVREITSVEVLDPATVKVTLRAPFAPFLNKLTGHAGVVLSPAAVQRLGQNLQRDLTGAGSGPFKFGEWKKDTHITLERNENYWKKDASGAQLPYLDKVVLKPFPDENVRLLNLTTGEADVLLGNPPFKDAPDLRRGSDMTLRDLPGQGMSVIPMHTEKEPFNNPAARRALSYAIDREQILQAVYFGNGRVVDTQIPETIGWAYDKDLHPYLKQNKEKAKAELAAAGKPNGFKFTLQVPSNSPQAQQLAELIKDQVKQVGIEIEIQQIEFATIIANANRGEFQAFALSFTGGLDPDDYLYSLYYTKAGQNLNRYSNPALDKLLDEGRNTLDTAKRAEAYKQVVKILADDQPIITYYSGPQLRTVRKSVQDYPTTYNGYWGARDWDKVWKTK
jgi:peptide/nickel transport system substrate-binding protein